MPLRKSLGRRGWPVSPAILSFLILLLVIAAFRFHVAGLLWHSNSKLTINAGKDPPRFLLEDNCQKTPPEKLLSVTLTRLDIFEGDLTTALARNKIEEFSVPWPGSSQDWQGRPVTLSALRDGIHEHLHGQLFRFMKWDASASCMQPLSQDEELATPLLPSAPLIVALHSIIGLPQNGSQWPSTDVLFWRERAPPAPFLRDPSEAATLQQGPPSRGFSSRATVRAATPPPLLCPAWIAEQRIFHRLALGRTFWAGPPGWAIQEQARKAMEYFGWTEVPDASGAAVVIRGGWEWDTMFEGVTEGSQLVMRHAHNRNLTAKDLLYYNLRAHARACPCAGAPLTKIVPRTWLVDDPGDCAALLALPRGTPLVRKQAELHVGTGIEMRSDVNADDCARNSSQNITGLSGWATGAASSGSTQDGSRGGGASSSPGPRTGIPLARRAKVVYQDRIQPFLVDARGTSLRVYLVVASYSPLVVFFNHAAGHLYVTGKGAHAAQQSWYTQHESFEALTFEQVERHLVATRGASHAGWVHRIMLPHMRDTLALMLASARGSFSSYPPATRSTKNTWTKGGSSDASGWGSSLGPGRQGGGHPDVGVVRAAAGEATQAGSRSNRGLGGSAGRVAGAGAYTLPPGAAHFDLWCIDFMLDTMLGIHLLEVTDSCMFKGFGDEEPVKQRKLLLRDVMALVMRMQVHVLLHGALYPSPRLRAGSPVNGQGGEVATAGEAEMLSSLAGVEGSQFELLYSELPGSEYDYLSAKKRCG